MRALLLVRMVPVSYTHLMIDKLVTESVDAYADEKLYPEEWDYEGLYKHLSQYFLTEEIMSCLLYTSRCV